MSCRSVCGVRDLAVSAFELTAVDVVVLVAVAWRGCSVADLEEVSVSSRSPVSVVVVFVLSLSLTAAVDVTVSLSILVLSRTYLDLRSFLLLRSLPSTECACVCENLDLHHLA